MTLQERIVCHTACVADSAIKLTLSTPTDIMYFKFFAVKLIHCIVCADVTVLKILFKWYLQRLYHKFYKSIIFLFVDSDNFYCVRLRVLRVLSVSGSCELSYWRWRLYRKY